MLSFSKMPSKCTLDLFFMFLLSHVICSPLILHSCATVPLSQALSTLLSPGWLFSNWWSARGRGCYGNLQGALGRVRWWRFGEGGRGHPLKETRGSTHSRLRWSLQKMGSVCVHVFPPQSVRFHGCLSVKTQSEGFGLAKRWGQTATI